LLGSQHSLFDCHFVCIYTLHTLIICPNILEKLKNKHQVSRREVEQCFENRCGVYLEDTREDHQTDPPTLWFVAETNHKRLLKVVFLVLDGNVHIKSAYEANSIEVAIYEDLGK